MSRSLGLFGLFLLGCGSTRIATPRYGEHPQPSAEWQEVDTPPPSVEVEEIDTIQAGRVWLDGQWVYQALTRRWLWEQGRWCVEPPGALFYAPPRVTRERQVRQENGEAQRLVRWNELKQRYEQVDVQTDHWRWHPGAFYVAGPNGQPTRWTGELSCIVPETGR